MIKDLLLVIDISTNDDAIVAAAVRMAVKHGAHLSVALFSVIPVPDYTVMVYPPFVTFEEYREKTEAKQRSLRDRAARAGVDVEIRILSDTARILLDKTPAQTRYADLVLFGPPATWEDEWLRRRVLENVILGSGRPVLSLPLDGTVPSFERALIGWNAGPEATRAIQVALPHLSAEAEVVVGIVNPEMSADHHGSDPGADIACHLARHGLRVDVSTSTAGSGAEAEALRSMAVDRGVDLLVLGAFARSRLRELILGGVTEDMIGAVATPTLLMH